MKRSKILWKFLFLFSGIASSYLFFNFYYTYFIDINFLGISIQFTHLVPGLLFTIVAVAFSLFQITIRPIMVFSFALFSWFIYCFGFMVTWSLEFAGLAIGPVISGLAMISFFELYKRFILDIEVRKKLLFIYGFIAFSIFSITFIFSISDNYHRISKHVGSDVEMIFNGLIFILWFWLAGSELVDRTHDKLIKKEQTI